MRSKAPAESLTANVAGAAAVNMPAPAKPKSAKGSSKNGGK
jgi:hypothetical protein